MIVKKSSSVMIRLVVLASLLAISIFAVILPINSVSAANFCFGDYSCSASGGNGGDGGDTGDATSGDVGPGGSCFVNDHSIVGDECGGSSGSSEPRSGSGDHSMNGGDGGDASVNLEG